MRGSGLLFGAAVVVAALAASEARAEVLSPWPFTVNEATLRCREPSGAGVGMATVTTPEGREFQLNGTAAARYPRVQPIWAHHPDARMARAGVRVDIGPAISRALRLCLSRGRAAAPLVVSRR